MLRALGRRSLDLYPRFVERVVAGAGRPVEFERLGTLEVATSADEKARLDRSAAELAADGVATHWLAPPALADLEPRTRAARRWAACRFRCTRSSTCRR